MRAVRPRMVSEKCMHQQSWFHTDTMNVFVNTTTVDTRQVVVNHMHHVPDVQATRRDTSGNEDRTFGRTEGPSTDGISGQLETIAAMLGTYIASSRSSWLRSEWIEVL